MASTSSAGGEISLISMRVALGQQLVEVHRAHDGADVGHRQV
jgi:hypothetical protein